jgi:hypothetical protein
VPGGIPSYGSIHDVRGGKLIEVPEARRQDQADRQRDGLTASWRYGPV